MKHLLSLMDMTPEQFMAIMTLSAQIKASPDQYRTALAGKSLAMIFQKSSTRTRVSFEVGMYQLGGHALFLSTDDIQLGRGETIGDTARVLGRFTSAIMARVFDHNDLHALTASGVPVINALSDLLHPCQALADALTIIEHKGRIKGVTMAYIGDGNNVCHSLVNLSARTGMVLRVATPEGYEPDRAIVAAARADGAQIELVHAPEDAMVGVDVVCTDTWASMGHEAEGDARRKAFAGYCVDDDMMALAAGDAIFMHCLPAHRGEEVTDSVIDSDRSVVFDEAENRLHTEKAVLLTLLAN